MTSYIHGAQTKTQSHSESLCRRQVSGRWADIESPLQALGAEIEERAASRIAVIFPGQMPAVLHRQHLAPMTDKAAVAQPLGTYA